MIKALYEKVDMADGSIGYRLDEDEQDCNDLHRVNVFYERDDEKFMRVVRIEEPKPGEYHFVCRETMPDVFEVRQCMKYAVALSKKDYENAHVLANQCLVATLKNMLWLATGDEQDVVREILDLYNKVAKCYA